MDISDGNSARPSNSPKREINGVNWSPLAVIHDDEKKWTVQIGLPNIVATTLKVTIDGGTLVVLGSVHGSRRENVQSPPPEMPFVRIFDLPSNLETEKGVAELRQEVLTISFNKSCEAPPLLLPVKIR